MAATKAQVEALDSIIRGEKKFLELHGTVRKSLVDKGYYEAGRVTQEGLKVTTVPTVEVDVITFGSDIAYNHPYWLDAEKTQIGRVPLVFPKGTEMVVTFAYADKVYGFVYEGIIQVNNKPVWVRIYRNPRFKFVKRLMPVKN